MKVAIVGSRSLTIDNLEQYLPQNTTELISGGARGIDACARRYALTQHLPITEFLPDYRRYGRGAPIRRNRQIVACAEHVVIIWDGHSPGTRFVIAECRRLGKPFTLYVKSP